MFKIIILAVLVTVSFGGTVDIVLEGAGVSPIGGWGSNLSGGLAGGIQANWLLSGKFRAGAGIEG